MSDTIGQLAGIAPGSPADALRARRPVTRAHGQASHDALFAPAGAGAVSLAERFAVAAYVAGLHRDVAAVAQYGAELAAHGSPGLAGAIARCVEETSADGPYGAYPAGPLSAEDRAGPGFAPSPETAAALGARLAAALAHAHLLVLHPRDSSAAAVGALREAGWSADAVVTLSQIVAFLSYQIRAAHGLRVLAGA